MRAQLEQCAQDFARVLAQQYAPKTVRKHTAIIALCIDFVCWDTDVHRIDEMTRGIANSTLRQWYRRKVGDRTDSELKTAIQKFFQFLAQEKGITNEAVLKSFQRLWPMPSLHLWFAGRRRTWGTLGIGSPHGGCWGGSMTGAHAWAW